MNPFKFGGFGGVHLHHISFLPPERLSSFFSFLLTFQGPSSSSPPICHPWLRGHGSVVSLRNTVRSIWSWQSRDGWRLLNSWFHFLLLKEAMLAGHYMRNTSHKHQLHPGEKRGILSQLLFPRNKRHHLTLKNWTGFKAELLKWFCNRYHKSSLDFYSLSNFEGKIHFVLNSDQNWVQNLKGKLALSLRV